MGDNISYLFGCFDQVSIGNVCISRGGPVSPVAENSADKGKVFSRHHRLSCGGMPKVMQAKPAELRVRADRAPAIAQRAVALPVREAREQEGKYQKVWGQSAAVA